MKLVIFSNDFRFTKEDVRNRLLIFPFFFFFAFNWISECTHFTWTRSRGGTCWFKSGTVSVDKAVVRKAAEIRCGYILTPAETSSENGIIWKDRNWAFGCDFYNRDLTTKQTRSHLCEKECQTTSECTHYTWYLFDSIFNLKYLTFLRTRMVQFC